MFWRLQGVLPESLIQVSLLRAQELVCSDSGSSYKHFRATKSLRRCIAEINGTSSHKAPAPLLMRFRKQASWSLSNKQQRGTYNLLQHIIPPFDSSYFLTLGSPWWMLYLAYFSIRHPGPGLRGSGFLNRAKCELQMSTFSQPELE